MPKIDRVFSLEEIGDAYVWLREGEQVGKVLVTTRG